MKLNSYVRCCKRCNCLFNAETRFREICDECNEDKNKRIWWEEKQVYGFIKCPRWLKIKYIEAVKSICQECHKEKVLTPHRIIRGNSGGLYTVSPLKSKQNNIKMVCSDCHKKIHGREF